MKISLKFFKSIYNCDVIIKDMLGSRNYTLNSEEGQSDMLEIDVGNSNFELTLIPTMSDCKSNLLNTENQNWMDGLGKRVGNALHSVMDKALLRVGCTYAVSEITTLYTYMVKNMFLALSINSIYLILFH